MTGTNTLQVGSVPILELSPTSGGGSAFPNVEYDDDAETQL
jgi:hypothetical protein